MCGVNERGFCEEKEVLFFGSSIFRIPPNNNNCAGILLATEEMDIYAHSSNYPCLSRLLRDGVTRSQSEGWPFFR